MAYKIDPIKDWPLAEEFSQILATRHANYLPLLSGFWGHIWSLPVSQQ